MSDVLTWSSILSLSLTTGLATAILNQGVGIFRERIIDKKKDRRAGYVAALQIIETLNAFASDCSQYAEWNEYDKSQGNYGRYDKLPEIGPFPDAGWDVLPGDIAVQLGDLRNDIKLGNENIQANDEIFAPPEAYDSATRYCIMIGMSSWNLASRLRKYYRLGEYKSDQPPGLGKIEELHADLMRKDAGIE